MADQKIIDRISALFAKAQATEYEAEAAVFNAKAMDLMVKYSVEMADLAGEDTTAIVVQTVMVAKPNTIQTLFRIACKVNNVIAIKKLAGEGRGTRATGEMDVVGTRDDIQMTLLLFGSLILQCEGALSRATVPNGMHARTFNNSFRTGFNMRVLARLLDAVAESTTSTPGAAVVLQSKAVAVRAAVDGGIAGKTRNVATVAHTRSTEGLTAGMAAGDRARLRDNNGILQGRVAIGA